MGKVFESPQEPLAPWGMLPATIAVEKRVEELTAQLDDLHAKVVQLMNSDGATSAIATYGELLIKLELWRTLYRIVLTHEGSWVDAWGSGLRQALIYAVRDDRTNGIEEGVRHERQSAARCWIRDNRRHLKPLDGEGVFLWVLGDL